MAGIAWCRIMAIKLKEVVAWDAVPIGNCFAGERRITKTIRATWCHLLPQSLRIFILVEKVCGRLTVLKVGKIYIAI
uniref:Putative secreted protein n=1 Tax=Ixodes ricinus TaxID=34613 RepID=A0A6B0U086_IXORI